MSDKAIFNSLYYCINYSFCKYDLLFDNVGEKWGCSAFAFQTK